MVALAILLLILLIFGVGGFALGHILWIILIALVLLWLIGFLVGGVPASGGRRRWYGRW